MYDVLFATKAAVMNLSMSLAGVNPHASPALDAAPSNKLEAAPVTIDKCFLVKTVGPLIDSVNANFVQFFHKYGGKIAVACLIIAFLLSLGDRGGPWFKRAAIVLFGLAIISALTQQVSTVGGKSSC